MSLAMLEKCLRTEVNPVGVIVSVFKQESGTDVSAWTTYSSKNTISVNPDTYIIIVLVGKAQRA